MAVDIETARKRASKIGAASASIGDFHSLFKSHNADKTTLLWAERIALAFYVPALLVALEPTLLTVTLLLLLVLIIVCFLPASRYLPGLQRHRNEGLIGMNIRMNLALLPIVIGVMAFAFLGTLIFAVLASFSFAALKINIEMPLGTIGAGAIAGSSTFLFLYFRWARKRCHQVWSETQ